MLAGLITLLVVVGVRGLEVLNFRVVRYLHLLVRIIRELDLGPVDVCPDGTVFDTVIWEAHTGWTAGWDACWSKEVSREDRSWVLMSFAIKVTQRCWCFRPCRCDADADAGQVKGISARVSLLACWWGSSFGQANESIGWCAVTRVCCRGTQARVNQMDGWRPDLIVGYMGKRSNAADALLRLGRQCMHKRERKKFCKLHSLICGCREYMQASRRDGGYAPDQTIFNTVSQEGDACKVTEGQQEGEVVLKI